MWTLSSAKPASPPRREIIAGSLRVRPRDLDPAMSLNMLGVDSLNLLMTVSAMEETFKVELSLLDTERLCTDDLIQRVAELVKAEG